MFPSYDDHYTYVGQTALSSMYNIHIQLINLAIWIRFIIQIKKEMKKKRHMEKMVT